MKKIILICLFPTTLLSQIQIGNDIDGEAAGDLSGYSVSLSDDGNIVAIGARSNAENGYGSGHVRVYENIGGTWSQIGSDIDGEALGDNSGYSVSISGDGSVVAIGAIGNDGGATAAGHVRVYENINGTWIQAGGDINGEASGDQSGFSVSLSADASVVAIGALYNGGNGDDSGHVRVFQNNGGTWSQVGADIDGESAEDLSGFSVSISADASTVAIGSINNDGNALSAGHVRVYKNTNGAWMQIGTNINGEGDADQSGYSVSLSDDGNIVAIGAPGINTIPGYVRVFKIFEGNWIQVGTDIIGEAADDDSGYSVSMSDDGSVVAIGARYNDGNGHRSGHVRVHQYIGGSWVQVGVDIDGEAAEDNSGSSVSLSSAGDIVAIGARYNAGNGIDSGHTRVYDLSGVLSNNSFEQNIFQVYPNPTSNLVTIELNEGLVLERINVYSSLGKLLKSDDSTLISLDELARGSYFLEVKTNQGVGIKTVIVE